MHFKKQILIFFTTCLLVSFSYGQVKNQEESSVLSNNFETRLEVLEENYKVQSQLLKDSFEVQADKLSNKFNKEKFELENQITELRYGLILIGLLGAGGIITLILLTRKSIKDQTEVIAERKIQERLDNIIELKRSELIALIDGKIEETQLKNETRIQVLSITDQQEDAFQKELKPFFEKMGFRNVESVKTSQFDHPGKKVDLLVLNDFNQSGQGHDLFRTYVQELSDAKIAILFLGARLELNLKNRNSVNFANSLFTFYSQIINVLKYQKFAS